MFNVGVIGLGLTGSAIAKHLLDSRAEYRIVMASAGPHSSKAGHDLGSLLKHHSLRRARERRREAPELVG